MSAAEAAEVQRLYGELMQAPLALFPAKNAELSAPNEHGVLIIENADGKVLHVNGSPHIAVRSCTLPDRRKIQVKTIDRPSRNVRPFIWPSSPILPSTTETTPQPAL